MENTLTVRIQGCVSSRVRLGRGGKEGANATPFFWNQVVDYTVAPLLPSWATKGWDNQDGMQSISNLIWADDIFLISSNWDDMKSMCQDLIDRINQCGLDWKPSSLTYMANECALSQAAPSTIDVRSHGSLMSFKAVPALPVLGILLDGKQNNSDQL